MDKGILTWLFAIAFFGSWFGAGIIAQKHHPYQKRHYTNGLTWRGWIYFFIMFFTLVGILKLLERIFSV